MAIGLSTSPRRQATSHGAAPRATYRCKWVGEPCSEIGREVVALGDGGYVGAGIGVDRTCRHARGCCGRSRRGLVGRASDKSPALCNAQQVEPAGEPSAPYDGAHRDPSPTTGQRRWSRASARNRESTLCRRKEGHDEQTPPNGADPTHRRPPSSDNHGSQARSTSLRSNRGVTTGRARDRPSLRGCCRHPSRREP